MASPNRRLAALLAAALVAARAAAAQEAPPAPLRLSFAQAVQRAAGEAPAVRVAGYRADEAVARLRQTRAALLPSVALGAAWLNRTFNRKSLGIEFPAPPGGGLPTLIGPFDNVDARLRLTQTVFDWSSLARVGAARAQVTGAEAERGAVAEGAALSAALAYLRAARAAALVSARRADSALAAELVALAQAQRAAGVSAGIDVTRAQAQLVTAGGARVVARNQLDRARIDLARALGLDPGTPVEVTDTLAADLPVVAVPAARDSAVALALVGRPDLAAEVARGDAARRARAAVTAERLPRFELAADYGVNGLTPGTAISTRQIGVQVTLPILDGFRREGRAAEQAAVERGSAERLRDLRQQVVADVDAALLDMGSARAQQAIAAEGLRLAAEEVAQARQRFQAGVAWNIEVINAQASLLRARDSDIDARFAAASARVALARAVGAARRLR